MRGKCLELGIAANLATLDEKFCERLMEPAKSHEEAMITDLKDISGYSFMGFICRRMNYITANGQNFGKPVTTNQLLDMVGHEWAYQHMERKKSVLTAKYLELYEGLRNNEHRLRKCFDRGGEAFGNHITMLIHNLTTSYLSSAYDGFPFNPYIIAVYFMVLVIDVRDMLGHWGLSRDSVMAQSERRNNETHIRNAHFILIEQYSYTLHLRLLCKYKSDLRDYSVQI